MSPDEAIPVMARDAATFWRRGWMLGTCGNMSIKLEDEPLEMLVSASGVDKARLRHEDFLYVGRGCKLLQTSHHQPSSEVTVHEVVYTRTEARAVYHVHSVWNNLASQLAESAVVLRDVEMQKGLSGVRLYDRVELPVVDNSHDMMDLARNVNAGLDARFPCVIVRLHGVYSWGRNLDEVRRHVEVVEFLLEYYCRARGLSLL